MSKRDDGPSPKRVKMNNMEEDEKKEVRNEIECVVFFMAYFNNNIFISFSLI